MDHVVRELKSAGPTLEDQLKLLSQLSGTSAAVLRDELMEHVALRCAFLLAGRVKSAGTYDSLEQRLRAVPFLENVYSDLAPALASVVVAAQLAPEAKRSSLRDIPYPLRRRLFARQVNRCKHCGWDFKSSQQTLARDETADGREPTLDHIMPIALGGDGFDNLQILCTLCNGIKESTVHVGEHGRTWINNYIYRDSDRRLAFWAFARAASRCQATACTRNARSSRLFAAPRVNSAPATLDNVVVLCEQHRETHECITY